MKRKGKTIAWIPGTNDGIGQGNIVTPLKVSDGTIVFAVRQRPTKDNPVVPEAPSYFDGRGAATVKPKHFSMFNPGEFKMHVDGSSLYSIDDVGEVIRALKKVNLT